MDKDISRQKQKLNAKNSTIYMSQFFKTSQNLNIKISDKKISPQQLNSYPISLDFVGKNDFIRFYNVYNGIYFPEGAIVSTEDFLSTGEDEYYELELECFYEIGLIHDMWKSLKDRSSEAEKFMANHIPFAGDAAGNDYFIEVPTGYIKYISWEYDIKDGLICVAPCFRDFCLAIRPLNVQ